MKIFPRLNLNNHGYYLVGDLATIDLLKKILEDSYDQIKSSNPDFFINTYENFTIDDARQLKIKHDTKPFLSGAYKIFVIQFVTITTEAQNALLKLFEEPASYARFFLVVSSVDVLLPTVRSRMSELDLKSISSEIETEAASTFLKSTKSERLVLVKEMLDDLDEQKIGRSYVINFVHGLEIVLRNEIGIKKSVSQLEDLSRVGQYLNDRSPSIKMLLEYLALVL